MGKEEASKLISDLLDKTKSNEANWQRADEENLEDIALHLPVYTINVTRRADDNIELAILDTEGEMAFQLWYDERDPAYSSLDKVLELGARRAQRVHEIFSYLKKAINQKGNVGSTRPRHDNPPFEAT